jgi:hypothetical protein
MSGNLTPPPERAFPTGRLQLRKEQLVSHIHAEQSPQLATPLRRRRFALGIAGVAAVASVAAAVVLFGTGSAGPSPAAAAVLRHAARAASHQPATDPPVAGQFVYTKSDGSVVNTAVTHGQTINFYESSTREAWIGPDGSGRLREAHGSPRFVTPADKAAWIAAGKPALTGSPNSDQTFTAGGLSYLDLSKLPSNPDQLKQLIEDRTVEGGPPGDAETFTIIGDLLRETYASPGVRSALYTIASQLPGVQLVGTVKDELGRSGTAVGYVSHGISNELIFDPQTSALLAERQVATADASWVPDGTVTESTSYVASGVVDSTSATAPTNP